MKLLQAATRIARGGLDAKARTEALHEIERVLLRRLGAKGNDQPIEDICVREGLERRWLRSSAMALLRTLNELIGDQLEVTVHEAVRLARMAVSRMSSPPGKGWARQETVLFKTTDKKGKLRVRLAKSSASSLDVAVNTVHGVKGEAADAVMFVISKNIDAAGALLSSWRTRCMDDEAKRVVYVGVTRAKRFLAIGVPAALSGELVGLLRERGVEVEEAPICRRPQEGARRQREAQKEPNR